MTTVPQWLREDCASDLRRKSHAYRLTTNTLHSNADGLSVSGEDNGWSNLRRVRQLLTQGGWKRSPLQIAFHNMRVLLRSVSLCDPTDPAAAQVSRGLPSPTLRGQLGGPQA